MARPQAYRLPAYFSEDFLNDYYDMLGAQHAQQDLGTSGPQHGASAPSHHCPGETEDGGPDDSPADGEGLAGDGEGDEPAPWRVQAQVGASDYRFVYVGPAGSWTPLHSDVLRSYSWSANVGGRKR